MEEMFILGDPRFLSGGNHGHASNITCGRSLPVMTDKNSTVTSASGKGSAEEIVSENGQIVHKGRDTYHQHEMHGDRRGAANGFNVFCRENDVPTVGIELETYCVKDVTPEDAMNALKSNWWHFEEDGSLDRKRGHELITEPLPPKRYRDIGLWLGLQNVCSPWLESWNFEQTGLHVHVGISQFKKEDLPTTVDERPRLADLVIAAVYYGAVPAAVRDKVFLRKAGGYCGESGRTFGLAESLIRFGSSTAESVFDAMYTEFTHHSLGTSGVPLLRRCIRDNYSVPSTIVNNAALRQDGLCEWTGHHTELNMSNTYTLEFRRGKGTINGVSIHRMVEFCTLLVRYVWKMSREPSMTVSPNGIKSFIMDNTTSEALRKTLDENWKGN